jgi:hypothetical protein
MYHPECLLVALMCGRPVYMRMIHATSTQTGWLHVGPVTIRWYEPPQMSTASARDGKEMSTTVNRCSHLDERNVSQEMSKDLSAACQ